METPLSTVFYFCIGEYLENFRYARLIWNIVINTEVAFIHKTESQACNILCNF